MAEIPKQEEVITSFNYDSLSNVGKRNCTNGENYNNCYKHLVGQKIISINSYNNQYHLNGPSYLRNKVDFRSVDGNIYIVKSVSYDRIEGHIFYLQKEDESENIKIYFEDRYDYIFDQSWVVLGYFEKMKELYLNKEFVYVHQDDDFDISRFNFYDRFMDYTTKDNLKKKIPCNSIWKCTDVLVLPGEKNDLWGYYGNRVILNIENEKYGKYFIFVSELRSNYYSKDEYFMSLEDFYKYKAIQNKLAAEAKVKAAKAAEIAKQKEIDKRNRILETYGEYYGNLIINRKIVIGMTQQHCREALGQPQRINKTTTAIMIREQWVYSSKYLYFENGILVTIQEF